LLSPRSLLFSMLFLVLLCPGCSRAQTQASTAPSALNRRIEVLVRGQLNLPAQYDVAIGQHSKSEFAGYDKLPITFSHNGAKRTIDFLISTDNKTLVRMDKMDLSKDPASAINIANRPFRGNADAKVTIVNFDDLECPYCARMHHELFPTTLDHYGDKVKIVYKDFPLVEMHPWALHAAVDANCLAAQNSQAYWEFVDDAHDHGEEISGPEDKHSLSASDAALDKMATDNATKHSLDMKKLHTCLSAQDTSAIKASIAEGADLGVDATPTIYVNGERVSGAEGTDVLFPVIDRALLDAGVTPPPSAAIPPAAKSPGGQE
jgi:protein-disulfide isomerase